MPTIEWVKMNRKQLQMYSAETRIHSSENVKETKKCLGKRTRTSGHDLMDLTWNERSFFWTERLPRVDPQPRAWCSIHRESPIPWAALNLWREKKSRSTHAFFSPDCKGFAGNPLLYENNLFHMSWIPFKQAKDHIPFVRIAAENIF